MHYTCEIDEMSVNVSQFRIEIKCLFCFVWVFFFFSHLLLHFQRKTLWKLKKQHVPECTINHHIKSNNSYYSSLFLYLFCNFFFFPLFWMSVAFQQLRKITLFFFSLFFSYFDDGLYTVPIATLYGMQCTVLNMFNAQCSMFIVHASVVWLGTYDGIL